MNSIPREKFVRRRIRHLLLFVIVLSLLALLVWSQHQSLGDTGFSTGYLLLSAVTFLSLYGLRKRLSFLRGLGSSSTWMQLHIYVALGAVAVFLMHIGFRIPQGRLEQVLAILFVGVSGSGVWGLYITRVYPRRLTATKQEYVFERIPIERLVLVQQAQAVAIATASHSETLGHFFHDKLLPFFLQRRSIWYLAFPNGRLRRSLLAELKSLDRYLAPPLRSSAMTLGRLVQKKDDMDFHFALQGQLKLWLFLHIALTYSLIVMALIHTVLAHAFDGGI